MYFFKTLTACFVILTVSSMNAQLTDLIKPSNGTKSIENKLVEESGSNVQKIGDEKPSENKQGTEPKPCLDPKTELKVEITTPQIKSTPIPLNFVTDNKVRTIPTNIPLIIKTANAKPAPAHYARLKAEQDRKKNSKPKKEVLNYNKVTPKDKITSKPILNFNKSPRKHKSKNINYFEDDTNVESLPPASKQPVTRKSKKPENNAELKKKTNNFETEGDYNNEVVQIENGTHSIRITKLPQPHIHAHEHKGPGHRSHSRKHQEFIYDDYNDSLDSLIEPLPPIKDDIILDLLINKNITECTPANTVLIDQPIIAKNAEDDSADVITITNHNYEEVEERTSACPESNVIEDNQPWASPTRNTAAANPYTNYLQNYQSGYDQYLKYVSENNPGVYQQGNYYPRVADLPSENEQDYTQTYSYPNEVQTVPEVFFGQKPLVRPDNSLGRIWRTWKDTEIKISKPNTLMNKPLNFGRNLKDFKYREVTSKPPAMYNSPPISLNGYYDNLNNQLTYPYSYPNYRYVL